jgi:hypothetical protein
MAMGGLSRETAIVAKAPEEVKATAMTTAAWRVGLVLILNANFMPKACGKGGKRRQKSQKVCWRRALVQEKGNRDNGAGESYGSSISMVCRCRQKPSGKEVSISLCYALGLRIDQTNHGQPV